jgi:hypothetical protein
MTEKEKKEFEEFQKLKKLENDYNLTHWNEGMGLKQISFEEFCKQKFNKDDHSDW